MSEIFDKDSTIKNKKQTKGLKRNSIDKFYTKKDIAEKCTNLMSEYLTISKNDLIIEPSAGNGSFIPYIKKIVNNYMFYDIEPDNEEVIKQDYLKLDYTLLKKNNKTIHLIGNPPFGRQSSTTIKFVKKSCEYCDSISFILPRSFKKVFACFFLSLKFTPSNFKFFSLDSWISRGCSCLHGKHHEAQKLINV